MSAMRAEDLPAVPGALPQDSAQTRAAARWTGPGQAARPQPHPATPRPHPALPRTPSPPDAPDQRTRHPARDSRRPCSSG